MQVEDILAFIRLVENPKEYKEKALEFQAYRDQIKANIQLSDDVADINKAKAKIAEDLALAESYIAKAENEAKEIVANAKVVYDRRHADLDAREKLLNETNAARLALETSVKQRDADLRKAEKDFATRNKVLQDSEASVAAKLQELTEKLDKLKSVMG